MPDNMNRTQSDAVKRIQRGEVDAHFLVVRTPAGIGFVEPDGGKPPASLIEGGFKVLGSCAIARGKDGSICTGTRFEESYRAHMPEHLKRVLPPVSEQEAILFTKAVRMMDVALNELISGTHHTAKLNEIWGKPVPDDLLVQVRGGARIILNSLNSRETDNDGAPDFFRDMIKQIFAENPKCENIGMVFAVGGEHEIVFLRLRNQARAQIDDIASRGGKAIGGYVYGNGVSVPFAIETESGCRNLVAVQRFAAKVAEDMAARN